MGIGPCSNRAGKKEAPLRLREATIEPGQTVGRILTFTRIGREPLRVMNRTSGDACHESEASDQRLSLRRTVSTFARHWLGIHDRLGTLASASAGADTCELAATSDKRPMTAAVVMATSATRNAPCSSNRLSASNTGSSSNRYSLDAALVFRRRGRFSPGTQTLTPKDIVYCAPKS